MNQEELSPIQKIIYDKELALWDSLASGRLEDYMSFWSEDMCAWPSWFNAPIHKQDAINRLTSHKTSTS